MNSNQMIHPFNGKNCEMKRLSPGDVIDSGDVYMSQTIKQNNSEIGRWFFAGDVLNGSIIGPNCNVNFIRLTEIVNE